MEEFKFVLKCFLISCVIVIFSQTRVSGETLENKAFVFLQHSETAQWVRDAADGGIKMIRNGAEVTKNFISEKFGSGGGSGSGSDYSSRRAASQSARTAESNTGIFRKLERHPQQQIQPAAPQPAAPQQGEMTAEAEENSEQNLEEQY